MNQTFSVSTNDNSSMKSNTSSFKETRLQSNQTSDRIPHDNENLTLTLLDFYHHLCGGVFHKDMTRIGSDHWCILEDVIRSYNQLTDCLEHVTSVLSYFFPNTQSQEFFLHIHSTYFQNCTNSELLLEDAPHGVVIALTLIPVSLIPLLVYLVVWKSKVQSG